MIDEFLRQVLSLLSALLLSVLSGQPIEETNEPPRPVVSSEYENLVRPTGSLPTPPVRVEVKSGWINDPEISWYGPGFYGNRAACGQVLTKAFQGVAHRALPCGTLVEFTYKGKSIIVPVTDRGPYVKGRTWDLTSGTCKAIQHCFTGPIKWRLVK